MPYPPSDPNQSIDALERQLLGAWKQERLFNRVIDATRYGPPFIFYEGPPTANGKPGIHHTESRAFKDIYPRFRAMTGHYVPRKAGWDCHGLPVELEVEKELGFSGKRDIEEFGIAEQGRLDEIGFELVHEVDDAG